MHSEPCATGLGISNLAAVVTTATASMRLKVRIGRKRTIFCTGGYQKCRGSPIGTIKFYYIKRETSNDHIQSAQQHELQHCTDATTKL